MYHSFDASKLLHTLAQQNVDKRHADDHTSTVDNTQLPVVSNSDIVAWLRSLAPLTEQQLYDNSWKD